MRLPTILMPTLMGTVYLAKLQFKSSRNKRTDLIKLLISRVSLMRILCEQGRGQSLIAIHTLTMGGLTQKSCRSLSAIEKPPRHLARGFWITSLLSLLQYLCEFPKEHTNVKRFCDIYFFSISASFQRSVWMSNGFAMCSFMPAARAFSRSSAKALAVIATIGICAFAGSGSARMRRVAS